MEPVRIGTAGWPIPAACRHLFPGDGPLLERYATRFNAVEINTSFYRPHRQSTYRKWAAMVPPDFSFAVKLPREITHVRRLSDCAEFVTRFVDEVAGLGPKLGAVLVQLPPSLIYEPRDAERLFDRLTSAVAAAIVCEPRHPSWFSGTAEALMTARRVARVAADPAPVAGAGAPGGWGRAVYIRLHGSPRIYHSKYDPEALELIAARITHDRVKAQAVWCIFDNTADFAATENALSLSKLLAGESCITR
jgi:uncharacterized protein YecE (DUF72 family)